MCPSTNYKIKTAPRTLVIKLYSHHFTRPKIDHLSVWLNIIRPKSRDLMHPRLRPTNAILMLGNINSVKAAIFLSAKRWYYQMSVFTYNEIRPKEAIKRSTELLPSRCIFLRKNNSLMPIFCWRYQPSIIK